MLRVWETVLGVKVFVEQVHHAHSPKLGMRTKLDATTVTALLSTEETGELVETLVKTMPPFAAYELTSRINREAFHRSERSRVDRLRRDRS